MCNPTVVFTVNIDRSVLCRIVNLHFIKLLVVHSVSIHHSFHSHKKQQQQQQMDVKAISFNPRSKENQMPEICRVDERKKKS